MEPHGGSVINQQDHVGNSARAQTPGYRQMYPLSDSSFLPLTLEAVDWSGLMACFNVAATATLADKKMTLQHPNRLRFTVFANNVDDQVGHRMLFTAAARRSAALPM